MKNKKVAFLLLSLAAVIWGTIIYRVFKAVHSTTTLQQIAPANDSDFFSSLADTFSVKANYRDPFLGRRNVEALPPKPMFTSSSHAITKWPVINYLGTIHNKNSDKKLALVKIDQKDYIMKASDIIAGVELSKIFKDSVIVLYQKEKKVITK